MEVICVCVKSSRKILFCKCSVESSPWLGSGVSFTFMELYSLSPRLNIYFDLLVLLGRISLHLLKDTTLYLHKNGIEGYHR